MSQSTTDERTSSPPSSNDDLTTPHPGESATGSLDEWGSPDRIDLAFDLVDRSRGCYVQALEEVFDYLTAPERLDPIAWLKLTCVVSEPPSPELFAAISDPKIGAMKPGARLRARFEPMLSTELAHQYGSVNAALQVEVALHRRCLADALMLLDIAFDPSRNDEYDELLPRVTPLEWPVDID